MNAPPASAVTGHFHKTALLALQMIWMIWKFRLGLMGKKKTQASQS